MEKALKAKEQNLREIISSCGSAVVAFSGGVDSTLLAYISHDVLGDRMVAVTAISPSFPQYQLEDARAFADRFGITFEMIETQEMDNPRYRANSPERCYYCKTELFTRCLEVAQNRGFNHVFDGSNVDDHSDYRPGMKAALEHNIRSPLAEAGFSKKNIRALSRHYNLPTWDMPAFACLASRLPYGEEIAPEKLERVDKSEAVLRELGFRQFRVRYHGEVGRVELAPEEFPRAFSIEMLKKISNGLKEAGFTFASLDLDGYRTGSLNEILGAKKKALPE
jgi:uncharacterized protein